DQLVHGTVSGVVLGQQGPLHLFQLGEGDPGLGVGDDALGDLAPHHADFQGGGGHGGGDIAVEVGGVDLGGAEGAVAAAGAAVGVAVQGVDAVVLAGQVLGGHGGDVNPPVGPVDGLGRVVAEAEVEAVGRLHPLVGGSDGVASPQVGFGGVGHKGRRAPLDGEQIAAVVRLGQGQHKVDLVGAGVGGGHIAVDAAVVDGLAEGLG